MSRQRTRPADAAEADVLLDVDSVSVEFSVPDGTVEALRDVSVRVEKGETLGIAGESGSGKSTLALAIVRYLASNGHITDGSISFKGRDLYALSKGELRTIRGNEVAHVAQNPASALNPSMVIGEQIKETIDLHQDPESDEAAWDQVYEVLRQVNIPHPEYLADRYPSELSGGQQQRALIAIGLSCNPDLLILDEPTTGLDVTTQAKLLDLVRELKHDYDVGILLITHNLAVIAKIADRVNILYAGEVMEKGPVEEVFTNPANPYTQALLATTPELDREKDLRPIPGQIPGLTAIPDGCIFADRCDFATDECRAGSIPMETPTDDRETRCIRWEAATADPIAAGAATERHYDPGDVILEASDLEKHYDTATFLQNLVGGHEPVRAVDGVDLSIREGETVGLVGESGCGKSTLGRTLLHLHEPTAGSVSYRGTDVAEMSRRERREFRSECQIIQQDPEGSLNPRKRIRSIVERPLELFTDLDEAGREERVHELLDQVNLSHDLAANFPHELSGGQQQRVAVARAFAANPSLVVLDEPVSSLDVSVQASILNLLDDLREAYDTSYLLISHDMGVIKTICDRLSVMYLGQIVESGSLDEVFTPPYHPYTRSLLSSIPSLDPHEEGSRIHLEGDVPDARDPPSGCSFCTRCPEKIGEVCETDDPALEPVGGPEGAAHQLSCHHEDDELSEEIENL